MRNWIAHARKSRTQCTACLASRLVLPDRYPTIQPRSAPITLHQLLTNMHINTTCRLDQALENPSNSRASGCVGGSQTMTLAAVADITVACAALDCGYAARFWRQVDLAIALSDESLRARPVEPNDGSAVRNSS